MISGSLDFFISHPAPSHPIPSHPSQQRNVAWCCANNTYGINIDEHDDDSDDDNNDEDDKDDEDDDDDNNSGRGRPRSARDRMFVDFIKDGDGDDNDAFHNSDDDDNDILSLTESSR